MKLKEVENKVNSNKKSDDKILVLFGAPGSVMVATDKSYIGNLVELAEEIIDSQMQLAHLLK